MEQLLIISQFLPAGNVTLGSTYTGNVMLAECKCWHCWQIATVGGDNA